MRTGQQLIQAIDLVIVDADQTPNLADATVPTPATLEFGAFAYASAFTNCSIAGQGFRELKAVLLAPQHPKQNERVSGGNLSGADGRDAPARVCATH
jgi:hypothetical protein